MPWCPKCDQNFEIEADTCPKCGEKLLDSHPSQDAIDLGNPVYLTTAVNEFEADILVSKLKASGILSILRYPGFGSIAKVYCGRCNFEVEILVPEKQLDDALAVINSSPEEDQLLMEEVESSIAAGEEPPEPEEPAFTRKYLFFLFLIVFFLFLLFILFQIKF